MNSVDEQVELLVSGTVITSSDCQTVIDNGAVAWQGERIVGVGPRAEIEARWPLAHRLDARGGLVLPGFINLHHHLYSALACGLAPARPTRDFEQILERLWWRLDRSLSEETVRLSAMLGAADCIRWGCTTLFDHHASPRCVRGSLDLIARVIDDAGLAGVLCYEISDRNGREEAVTGLVENLRFIEEHAGHPRLRGMLGIHASFTVSDRTLDEAAENRPKGSGCHIHIGEDPLDREASRRAFGADPLQRLVSRELIDDTALLVHGVDLSAAELALVASHGSTLVHCPESNANNAVGPFDVEHAAAACCAIGLGTDGMSSSMLRSLRAALLAQHDLSRDPSTGYLVHPRLLATNTIVARRLFDEPHLGELTEGAPADVCVIDCVPPTPVTSDNAFAHLVFGAAEAPVRHTIARGRVLLEDFEHRTLDPHAIAETARKEAPAVWRRFRELEASASE